MTHATNPSAAADCTFCGVEDRRPPLVLMASARWLVVHVDQYWPLGSLYLVAREHVLAHELSVEHWTEAAPLIAGLTRLVKEERRADRVYYASFSERNPHFHMLLLPKTPEHSAEHRGLKASALLASFAAEAEHVPVAEATEIVRRYRERLPEYVPGSPASVGSRPLRDEPPD